ncbi:hypothetical protein AB1N83_003984 [Pleurotus pulmonarius]
MLCCQRTVQWHAIMAEHAFLVYKSCASELADRPQLSENTPTATSTGLESDIISLPSLPSDLSRLYGNDLAINSRLEVSINRASTAA